MLVNFLFHVIGWLWPRAVSASSHIHSNKHLSFHLIRIRYWICFHITSNQTEKPSIDDWLLAASCNWLTDFVVKQNDSHCKLKLFCIKLQTEFLLTFQSNKSKTYGFWHLLKDVIFLNFTFKTGKVESWFRKLTAVQGDKT